MSKIFADSYVLKYQEDYFKFKYKDMSDNLDSYFKNIKAVNFDIIHHECLGMNLKVPKRIIGQLKMNICLITQKRKLKLFYRLPFITKGTIYGSNVTL